MATLNGGDDGWADHHARKAAWLAGVPYRGGWRQPVRIPVHLETPNPFQRAPAGKVGVGLVQPGMWSGGAERYHLQVWKYIDRSRWHVVGTACARKEDHSPLRPDYEAIAPVGVGKEAVLHLAKMVDVLIVWGMPDLDDWLPPGLTPPVLVMASHGRCDWSKQATAHAMRRQCKAVVIASEDCRHTVPDEYKGPVFVGWSMVEPARIEPTVSAAATRKRWGVAPGDRVALHVARPSPEKRCELAYRGLPPGWAYVSIGTGPVEDEIKEDARKTANGPALFLGYEEDVGSALNAADVMVLPSENEGCSLAAIEAHAAGVPVVATPIGLYREHPEFVRLVSLDATPADVGRAMSAVVDDPLGTAERVRAAQDHVVIHHSPEAFGRRWDAILDRAVRKPPPGPGTVLKDWLGSIGLPTCGACSDHAARMDAAGVDGVLADLEAHVAEIQGRAPLVPALAIRAAIRQACEKARAHRDNEPRPLCTQSIIT